MKKLILVAAIAAATSSAFAMEAMDESVLSETTGQAGITIEQGAMALSIASLRYLDTDGVTGAQYTAMGSPGALTAYNVANNSGALKISNLTMSASKIVTDIDVASTGNLAGSRTGLILNSTISNLTLDLGGISLDNGTHTADGLNAASNGSLGGIKLDSLSLGSGSSFLITPKNGGAGSNSGLVLTSLRDLNVSVNFGYYDTDVNSGGTAGADGYIKAPVKITATAANMGSITVDVVGAGSNGGGLQLTNGLTRITTIELGNNGAGNDQIMIGSTNVGRIGINDLRIGGTLSGGLATGSSTLTIRGH